MSADSWERVSEKTIAIGDRMRAGKPVERRIAYQVGKDLGKGRTAALEGKIVAVVDAYGNVDGYAPKMVVSGRGAKVRIGPNPDADDLRASAAREGLSTIELHADEIRTATAGLHSMSEWDNRAAAEGHARAAVAHIDAARAQTEAGNRHKAAFHQAMAQGHAVIAAKGGAWNEDDHPRDDNGRFT